MFEEPTPTTDALIDTWFREHFCDRSPAVEPDAYNIAYAAAQDLKKRLAAHPSTTS